ncbi:MAG TPA: nucleotidyl transferase AbiEii/AbiGii toxin family protein [bacterium]|nr:nucleotidyl transferase AbiEii/AbiGii toxin family protein [Candidatus Shapirobacteria bacterium]HOD87148.1 nucleotidyl transferase AbiEii/AbiGii toxin family protein [bacterium]HQB76481.1 nucleotidyl transferase AbiEii/AbiGii toxin family protein [bacterium]HQL34726.1 nucleotidyl transferase AbiEii/AbiGii toxin family protein [bacterium]
MLNKEKHQLIMGQVLKDIYTDVSISPLLGFKGDTCTYFFYNLPRFSVDLDFDLLEVTEENQKMVFEKIVAILSKYGTIKDQYIKRFTVFALLSYGDEDHNVKVEINVRKLAENMKDLYEMKEYLGISMMVAKKDYLFAGKLAALTLRTETAMRDIFDIQYFAKNHWDINAEVIKNFTGKTVKEYLPDCVAFIEKVKDSQMLQGLGELIDNEKQKDWVRNHLKADAIFMLKNYQSVLK